MKYFTNLILAGYEFWMMYNHQIDQGFEFFWISLTYYLFGYVYK